MPAGLQVWDSSGNLVVDITSRLSRFVGSTYIDGTPGQVSDPLLANGEIWFAFQPEQIWGFQNMDTSRPIIAAAPKGGTTIGWTYSPGATNKNERIKGFMFYGVF